MILEVILTLLFAYFVHYFITMYMLRRKIPPGPFPFPIVGNAFHVLYDQIDVFNKLAEKYGDIVSLHFPRTTKVVVLNSAALVREALLDNGDSAAGRSATYTFPFNTLLKSDVGLADYSPEWQFRRKVFISAMHVYGAGLEQAYELAGHAVNTVIKEIDASEEKPFSPEALFQSAILVQLWDWLTTKKVELDDPVVKRFLHLNDVINGQSIVSSLYQIFPFLMYLPTSANREFNKAKEVRFQLLPEELNMHKKTYTSGSIRDLTDSFISGYEKEIAKEANKQIGSMDDIAGLMIDVIFAGSHTTSTSLNWLFFYMMVYPDIQEKVHKELNGLSGFEGKPSLKDIEELDFLQATLCEVQRASGLLKIFLTNTIRDMTIAGYHVPKGALVVVNLDRVHHDPLEWPEPEKFKPERFLDADGKFVGWNKLHAFFPFGAGRRYCAGQSLAKVMMVTFASTLLRLYKLELPPGEKRPNPEEFDAGVLKTPKHYKVVAKRY